MSLDGGYDRSNIFARILRGEAPAAKVYEDETTLAFMDVFPQSRGHVLVTPKSEARNLLDVDPATLQALILKVQRIAQAVREALQPDGITVMQFNGAEGGQTVYHLHFHIIPRYAGQPIAGHGKAGMADADDLAALASQLGARLA